MNYPFDLPAPVERIEVMGPHMTKYHLVNGQVLHQFTQADTGHPHDHPFAFTTTILQHGYEEDEYLIRPDGSHQVVCHVRLPGQTHRVEADTAHRITRLLGPDCWTLMTPGAKVKEPGFYRFKSDRTYRRDWNGRWKRFTPRVA